MAVGVAQEGGALDEYADDDAGDDGGGGYRGDGFPDPFEQVRAVGFGILVGGVEADDGGGGQREGGEAKGGDGQCGGVGVFGGDEGGE
ncbi:hypothetical protein [Dermatophilus congolensis]|uniref:hypothetical protein n=1 Tax=Dermatophilus congolensis TaxID=1863 RepID=UPI001FBB7D72|nr:hypothetical protein [Dermatophilus congolensis]